MLTMLLCIELCKRLSFVLLCLGKAQGRTDCLVVTLECNSVGPGVEIPPQCDFQFI